MAHRWHWPAHINVLELTAVELAVRWVCSHSAAGPSQLQLLTDSSVACGALRKGRSSSRPVLRLLRRVASILLASGLTLHVAWVPTSLNPADGPSRLWSL